MKRIAVLLVVFVALAASVRGAVFRTTLLPSAPSKAGGGALLTVNPFTRGWGLMSTISNLTFSARSAGIFGPIQPGQQSPPWIPLGYPSETEGELTGGGVLTEEEFNWLWNGSLEIKVFTDDTQFPEGELSGRLIPVPEPATTALIASLGLCACAVGRRLGNRIRTQPNHPGRTGS
jgi:hypothetical protein